MTKAERQFEAGSLAWRIQSRLSALGISAKAASEKAGLSASAIKNIFDGASSSPRLDTLQKLAPVLHTSVEWLSAIGAPLNEAAPSQRLPADATIIGQVEIPTAGGARDLPVYGTAVGGSELDGDFRLNGEIIEYTSRPRMLYGRKRAFAVNIQNDSMHPIYKPGRKIYVDEDARRPSIGDEVLIELYPTEDGEPGPAYIKTLVSRSSHTITVSQYNPPKEIPFKADQIKQILRVIPYDELLGI